VIGRGSTPHFISTDCYAVDPQKQVRIGSHYMKPNAAKQELLSATFIGALCGDNRLFCDWSKPGDEDLWVPPSFVPLVLECHSGAMSPLTRKTVDCISRKLSSASGSHTASHAALRLAQRIAIALHRENARALLQRAAPSEAGTRRSHWSSFSDRCEGFQ